MQKFSLLPLYFSRDPILSFNEEYINLDRMYITSLVNDDFIQNLVFRNSKNLHTVLTNYENLGEIQKTNFDLAFSNYLTRLCSRPTPFDINSNISLNYLTEQLETDDMSLNYNIQLSSELLQFIKNDMLNNAAKIDKLKVKFNKLNLDKNNHYHFYYLNNNESNQSENFIFKIVKTNILSDIDDLTQNNFIEISEIIKSLKHKYTEVDNQKVLTYLLNLIQKNILITELDLSTTESGEIKKLINIYQKVNYTNEKLTNKLDELVEKNDFTLDEVVELEKFFSTFSEKFQSNNAINCIPSNNDFNTPNLSEFSNDIKDILSFIKVFSGKYEYINEDIMEYFRNQYEYDLVPIKKIIEDIEFTNIWTNQMKLLPNSNIKLIEDLIINAIKDNKKSIDLSVELDVENLMSDENDVFSTGEMVFYLVDDKVILEQSAFSDSIGKLNGRFLSSINKQLSKEYLELINDSFTESFNNPNVLNAELDIMAKDLKFSNITKNDNPYHYSINLNTFNSEEDKNLDLNDLYIGCDKRGLYIWSKSKNSFIMPHVTNASSINERYPLIYNILAKIGLSRQNQIVDLMPFYETRLNYIPALKYREHILLREQWKLDYQFRLDMTNERNVLDSFMNWLKRSKLNLKYIGISLGEAPTVYNLENEYHVSNIIKFIKKNITNLENITFINVNDQIYSNDSHFKQYVISFYNNKKITFSKKENTYYLPSKYSEFDEWKYYKVYPAYNNYNNILLKILDIVSKMYLDEWHYVNFRDRKDHIRIRYKPGSIQEDIDFELFLTELTQNLEIEDYSSHIFSPEINRYGGPITSSQVLGYFTQNSVLTRNLLTKGHTDNVHIILSIYYILSEQLGMNNEEIYEIYSDFHRLYSEEYREIKSFFIECYKSNQFIDFFNIYRIEQPKKINFFNLKNKDFIQSLIHMHVNRLIGIDKDREHLIYSFLAKLSKSLIYIGG